MDPKNKVYINPNFKRIPQTHSSLMEDSKTTYFNKYFPQNVAKKQMYYPQDDINNRKIYVNPNFVAVNNTFKDQDVYVSDDYIRNYKNTIHLNQKISTNYSFPNNDIKHTPKYEVLQNKNPIYSDRRILENSETYNIIKQNQSDVKVVVQPVNNFIQEPLSKSRYCIVRKINEVSPTVSKISLNKNMPVIPQNKVHILTSTSSSKSVKYTVPNNQKMKLCNMTPQKVTKIKISKYKTIPISYLKVNSQTSVVNKIKPFSSAILSYNKVPAKNGRLNAPLLSTYSKSRFKFVKSKTSVSSIVEAKPAFKTTLLKFKRNLALNKSKINVKGKYKINNIPCRLFIKYGKCLRKEHGKCDYLHDRKHVSLCRKFLKGICHDKQCTLSHELSAKKMPTCYFYLKGMCTKEHCPYLHIKLSETTKICQNFIKGYCEKGVECSFRHVKKQDIKRTKDCKLIISNRCQQRRINKNVPIKLNHKKNYNINEIQEKNENDCRYYDDNMNKESSCEIIKPTRCKLGTLPSFIQV